MSRPPTPAWPDLGPEWNVEVDLRKTPLGRRVAVRLTHRPTGRTAEGSAVGGLRKSDRDHWVAVLVRRLAQSLGAHLVEKPAGPRVIGKGKKRRRG